jgi:hypothetical protein
MQFLAKLMIYNGYVVDYTAGGGYSESAELQRSNFCTEATSASEQKYVSPQNPITTFAKNP